MFYELVSTTNEKFQNYVGRSGQVSMVYGMFYFTTGDRYLQSSTVLDRTDKDGITTFFTLNSIYVFKELGESVSPLEFVKGVSDGS